MVQELDDAIFDNNDAFLNRYVIIFFARGICIRLERTEVARLPLLLASGSSRAPPVDCHPTFGHPAVSLLCTSSFSRCWYLVRHFFRERLEEASPQKSTMSDPQLGSGSWSPRHMPPPSGLAPPESIHGNAHSCNSHSRLASYMTLLIATWRGDNRARQDLLARSRYSKREVVGNIDRPTFNHKSTWICETE
jgi:hypothetical protein